MPKVLATPPAVLRPVQLRQLLSISARSYRRWLHAGLPSIETRFGRRHVVADVLAWLQGRHDEPAK